ncbi:Uncharacterised protein [uncultured archaeon]|nr:Uncharacterised protein [uncultured archaeon]
MFWLTRFDALRLLAARRACVPYAEVSLDLGMTRSVVDMEDAGVSLPGGVVVGWDEVEAISTSVLCHTVEDGVVYKAQFFAADTNRMYRLIASKEGCPPTAEIGSVRMHRVKEMDPWTDARMKVQEVTPVFGRCLDTCTGLGYSAINLVDAGAAEVVTVERDPNMVKLQDVNPWSAGLNNLRVKRVEGDVSCVIKTFGDASFSRVLHDPPRVSLAGELYGRVFYGDLFRVLLPGGFLYHYVGSPGNKYRGRNAVRGVIDRLKEAGFSDVREVSAALGVVARKDGFVRG